MAPRTCRVQSSSPPSRGCGMRQMCDFNDSFSVSEGVKLMARSASLELTTNGPSGPLGSAPLPRMWSWTYHGSFESPIFR